MAKLTRFLTTGQAAVFCHVSKNTVVKWTDGGLLRSRKIPGGTRRLIDAGDLVDLLVQHRIPVAAELRALVYVK